MDFHRFRFRRTKLTSRNETQILKYMHTCNNKFQPEPPSSASDTKLSTSFSTLARASIVTGSGSSAMPAATTVSSPLRHFPPQRNVKNVSFQEPQPSASSVVFMAPRMQCSNVHLWCLGVCATADPPCLLSRPILRVTPFLPSPEELRQWIPCTDHEIKVGLPLGFM